MDCTTARGLLAFRRPGGPSELAPEDGAALDRHLADCSACAAFVRRQDGFDAAVASAMKAVPVPAKLRCKLVKIANDRRAARFRRSAFTYAAAAAVVLLAVFLAYGVRRATQPVFDAEGFALHQDHEIEAPDQAVEEWLTAEGLPTELPLPLDFRHYAFHGTQRVAGREVPVIVFRVWRPNQFRPDTLKLFLIRDMDFRFDELQDAASSLHTAVIVKDDRKANGVVYVALYNTPNRDQFLAAPKQTS